MLGLARFCALFALLSLPASATEPDVVPVRRTDAGPSQSAELRLRARAAALRLVKQTARRLGFGDDVVRQLAEQTAAHAPLAWRPDPLDP